MESPIAQNPEFRLRRKRNGGQISVCKRLLPQNLQRSRETYRCQVFHCVRTVRSKRQGAYQSKTFRDLHRFQCFAIIEHIIGDYPQTGVVGRHDIAVIQGKRSINGRQFYTAAEHFFAYEIVCKVITHIVGIGIGFLRQSVVLRHQSRTFGEVNGDQIRSRKSLFSDMLYRLRDHQSIIQPFYAAAAGRSGDRPNGIYASAVKCVIAYRQQRRRQHRIGSRTRSGVDDGKVYGGAAGNVLESRFSYRSYSGHVHAESVAIIKSVIAYPFYRIRQHYLFVGTHRSKSSVGYLGNG